MTTLLFKTDGTALCFYTEDIPLAELGQLTMHRATNIEFNESTQRWEVRLATFARATALFSHPSRQACLDWERNQLHDNTTMLENIVKL